MSREVIQLPHATIEVEERSGYLLVIESGRLETLDELQLYTRALDALVQRTGIRRAVIDARGEVGDATEEVREAMWGWLLSEKRGFEVVAFVLPTEMAVARVNMTSVSLGAKVRAFEDVRTGQRWLLRDPRFSTQAMSSIPPKPATSSPPRRTTNSELRPTARSSEYLSREPRVDRVQLRKPKKRNGGGQVA